MVGVGESGWRRRCGEIQYEGRANVRGREAKKGIGVGVEDLG